MNPWKVLGLAGLAGVAAAGVIIAREQRQRTQLAPEEIRARLQERLERGANDTDLGHSVGDGRGGQPRRRMPTDP